ncbi:MAG TPA: hypothetical protein VME66_03815 [Candidatus Acidoferrales bacterium]|nr:hypothetical protein [Candidatus Acidoferrales bacterium]
MLRTAWMSLASVAVFPALLTGCMKLGDISGTGGSPPITPTPSASPTFSPAPCGTPSTSSSNVFVAMGPDNPITTPTYGPISGYSLGDVNGDSSPSAQLINMVSSPSGAPITTANTMQFVNVDSSETYHSAVGFAGDAFPSTPYTFPSPLASPTSNVIQTGTRWSTGRIAPQSLSTYGTLCFSQVFTLKTGVYYFGDLDYYNYGTRDVLIVSGRAPKARHSLSSPEWKVRSAKSSSPTRRQ